MSTVSVINVKHPSSASNNIVLDNAGNATFAGTAAMASSFLRNRIINGAMEIDQRNAGASFSSGVGAVTYGLDRFYVFSSGAAVTGQRVNPSLTGFPNALRVTGAAGATYTEVGQRVESANIADLAGSTVIVSFWAAASVATSVNVYMNYANTQDNFSASTGIGSTVVSITSTLTRYTVSFALPSQAANGVVVGFTFGSGLSSGTFTLTGVQLEVGTAATPFERRQFGTELMLCQRYFSKTFPTSTAVQDKTGTNTGAIACPVPASVTGFYGSLWQYPVNMRATPTLAFFAPQSSGANNWVNGGNNVTSGPTSAGLSSDRTYIFMANGNAFSLGGADVFYIHATANAEL